MQDQFGRGLRGRVRLYDFDSKETLYERKNVICASVSYLFARLLNNNDEPFSGVWGLAVGAGGSGGQWSATQQPDPTAVQTALVSEIKRKQLSTTQYLDSSGNPTTTLTTSIEFTTLLNATTDNITTAIREMGLIGGGTSLTTLGGPTNMLTAPYFNPTAPVASSVNLINYITMPSFILPAGITLGISWTLDF